MFYHLLIGRPPFVGEALTDTLEQVLNTEPVSPRLLNPSVPRDLETICLKCLEKEPGKRYGTAQMLAEEIGCFLSHEPVQARPIRNAEKLWRWCRRKPAIATLATSVAILVLTLAIGSTAASLRLEHLRRQADEARINAEQLRQRAEAQTANSERRGEFMTKMWADVESQLASIQNAQMFRQILDRSAERVIKNLAYEPEVEAAFREQLGVGFLDLGSHTNAEAMFMAALSLRKQLRGGVYPELASVLHHLAQARALQGRDAEAISTFRQALDMRQQLSSTPTLDVASTLFGLAQALSKESNSQAIAEAQTLASQCLSIHEAKAPDAWRMFATRELLGGILLSQDKYAEAEPLLVSAYHGMREREILIPKTERFRIKQAAQRLVQLHEEKGQREIAAEWKKKLGKPTFTSNRER